MDCKKPTRGTGFFPSFMMLFFISTMVLFGQTEKQRNQIQNNSNVAKLKELISKFEKDVLTQNQRIRNFKKTNPLEFSRKELDGTVVQLNAIGIDGTPLYYTTYMGPTSKVSRADALYSGGALATEINGLGMQVGIWDAGVALTTHQEFDRRVANADNTETFDSHSTMVTGTIVSAGVKEKARGVAYQAQALTHDWSRDKIEVTEAAVNGLLLSNHSYGIKTDRVPDWYFGSYIKVSQDWDKIMYNAPYYLMVSAAGNAQKSFDNDVPRYGKAQDGFDLLLGFTTSKNGLVIGGADVQLTNNGKLKDASVSRYSSFGPIDDGRIKPDLAGDGALIYSTGAANNKSYDSAMGTSMAAPGVTGSLLLLQQYHEELYGSFMKAATLKGLTLHTADDVKEPGPDYKMGWGVINAQAAAQAIKNKAFSAIMAEENLSNGNTYELKVKANENEPLIVSVSWTDPESTYVNRGELNATTAALVNDIDVRITKNGVAYTPWKLNAAKADKPAEKGDNRVDPFERIDVERPSGEYTITISHKGNLVNEQQDFTLIVTGAKLTACELIAPKAPQIEAANEEGCTITWKWNEDTLYEFQYKGEADQDWTTDLTWEANKTLDSLILGQQYTARLRSVCSENLASEYSEELQFIFEGKSTTEMVYESLAAHDDLQISVFPNPAVNVINIDAPLTGDAVYTIRSTSGNRLKSGKIDDEINVAELSTGIYILTVEDYSGAKSTKFFKS